MRKLIFVDNHFYHIYNRGVEKRDIFMDDKDFLRFIHDLYEFNDQNSALNLNYYIKIKSSEVGLPRIERKRKRELLVKILVFCLMPNHFHLILKQLVENGISLFMQKLGTGYINYFNLKYQRVGPLFQGRYKAIEIKNENYLLHLSRYQHLNPLELIESDWKEKGISNWKKVNQFLESYRWSSYPDYIGKKNFSSVTQRELINTYFEEPEDYKRFMSDFLSEDLDRIKDLIIES